MLSATAPTKDPPTFGCANPATVEAPFNWKPVGDPVIKTTGTVATSGILATFEQAPFPNNYTFTFPNAGTFAYICRIHEHMVGTIVVAAPTPPVLPQTGGGLPWRSLALVLGALTVLFGLAMIRLRSLVRH